VDSIAPSIPKGLDLLRFTSDVRCIPVLDIAAGGRPLEVAVELDAIGGVEVDALHLSAQSFPFGQACHDLQAVSQNHSILPMSFVLVELGSICPFWQTVEVSKQIQGV